MPMPKDVGIIDLMLGIPSRDPTPQYAFMKPLFRDADREHARYRDVRTCAIDERISPGEIPEAEVSVAELLPARPSRA